VKVEAAAGNFVDLLYVRFSVLFLQHHYSSRVENGSRLIIFRLRVGVGNLGWTFLFDV